MFAACRKASNSASDRYKATVKRPLEIDGSSAGGRTIVGVIPATIVAFQPNHLLAELLSTLDRNQRRIFIYLNGGVSPEIESRLGGLSNAHVIRNHENAGLAHGLNVLAAAAEREGLTHLQFFDQDSSPEPELPAALTICFNEALRDFEPLAVVAPRLTPPPGEHYQEVRIAWRDRFRRTVDFAPTSGSILALAAWKDVGPFRADYFIDGIDVEWCLRAWHRGYGTLVFEETSMVHRWGSAIPPTEVWKSQILRQPNDRIYFYVRNAVNNLRSSFIPRIWRLRFALRLFAQLVILLSARANTVLTRKVVRRAVSDGWNGRLGSFPPELSTATH